MRRHACFGLGGVFALARSVGLSLSVLGLSTSQLFSASQPAAVEVASTIEQALPLLEKIHQDQKAMREAIEFAGARQDAAFDRQAKAMRDQRDMLFNTLLTQRAEDKDSRRTYNRIALTTAFAVTGLLLFAMACIAWSLYRALQRLSTRKIHWPSRTPLFCQSEVALVELADARALAVIEQLDRRLLKLEDATSGPLATAAASSATPKGQSVTTPVAGTSPHSPAAARAGGTTSQSETQAFPPGDFV